MKGVETGVCLSVVMNAIDIVACPEDDRLSEHLNTCKCKQKLEICSENLRTKMARKVVEKNKKN